MLGSGAFAVVAGGVAHRFTCRDAAGKLMPSPVDWAYDTFWDKNG